MNEQNTKMRDPVPLAAAVSFLSTGESYKSYVYEYYLFLPDNE